MLERLPGWLELPAPPQRMCPHLIPHCCSWRPQLPALKHKRGDVTAAACSEPPEHDANVAFDVRETKQATERAKGICREEDLALLNTSMACWEQLLQTNAGPQTPLLECRQKWEMLPGHALTLYGAAQPHTAPCRGTQPGWASAGKEPRGGSFPELQRSISHPPPPTHTDTLQSI